METYLQNLYDHGYNWGLSDKYTYNAYFRNILSWKIT